MPETILADDMLAAIRRGDEALDRGTRGPALELALLADAGLLSAPLPVGRGGRGWGTSATGAEPMFALLVALGGASLPLARIYEGHVNAIKLVLRHGDQDQQQRVCDAVTGGAILGVWGAERDRPVTIDADGLLAGVKTFASGLGEVTLAIVTARVADGLRMVVIDATDPARGEIFDWDVDGMVGSQSGRFDCTGLPAMRADCLGAADALFIEPDFNGGVWRLCACYAGAMERLARLTAQRIGQEGRHGDPLAAHRLGHLAMEARGAALWARSACLAVETSEVPPAEAVATTLFAREAIEQAATRLLALVERLNGTAMHRRGSEIGRLARDLRLYLRQADLDGKLRVATAEWVVGGP
ncbi:acyl-CoA dehydrogenase family protein [Sphingomonas sp. UYP23]